MRARRISWIVLALALSACALQYKDDLGFLVSAQANSPEFPVYVNGRLCADTEGKPGACTKRIRSTESITLRLDAQPYDYLMTVNCASQMPPVPPITVPAGHAHTIEIKPQDFSQYKNFTCTGEVSPQDRKPPLSAEWEAHFIVVDVQYVEREQTYVQKQGDKNYLVLGQHARTSWVFDDGEWHQHRKATVVRLKSDPGKVKAYSESYAARFNYYRMTAEDRGIPDENER